MIVTSSGRIVWYSPRVDRVHNLSTIVLRGRRLLALYQRRDPARKGYYELLDSHYHVVQRVRIGDGYATDSHEFQVTRAGTAYLDSYHPVKVPGVGRVTDWVVREIDLRTGAVRFEWHALAHVPLRASYAPRPPGGRTWDFFHGNSIEPPAPGGHTIIVSSRNTSAIYGIDRRTGAVEWVLGGKRDAFGLARRHPSWIFCGQHDARRRPDGTITVFDDGGSGTRDGTACPVHPARVERFRLDVARHRARRVSVITSRRSSPRLTGLFPTAVGSARLQRNGDTLISWGTTGVVTEVTPARRIDFALRLEPWTYRAVRSSWVGRPDGRPAIAVRCGRRATVWASWNGATEIARWSVLAGAAPDALRPAGRPRAWAGLETRVRVGRARYLAVVARDARGRELGRSRAVTRRGCGRGSRA
jgi:Arylsulfotransferase (ASST)